MVGTHDDLDVFVEPLFDSGRQVISMDLPAHGQSGGNLASLPDLANSILHAVLDIARDGLGHRRTLSDPGIAYEAVRFLKD
jgi:alpha-beta hydrolase superfamily lysophospholipase